MNVTSPADVIFHLLDGWTCRVSACRLHIGPELAVCSFIIFYGSVFGDLIPVDDNVLKIVLEWVWELFKRVTILSEGVYLTIKCLGKPLSLVFKPLL